MSTVSPSTTRVGWIGTGVMGLSMCGHLLKAGYTHRLQPHHLQSPASPRLRRQARRLPTRRRVPIRLVFTIVGYPSDVRSVLVDMTTSEPSLAVEISQSAAAKNCSSIDAPVTGGDVGAKNGTLAILAGGDETVVNKLIPLFALMGKVNYMGAPGKGQFAKLANQTIICSTMLGLVEGMMFAHKSGLDVGLFLKAISVGAAGSRSLDLYGGRILKRDFEPGFYVNHFVKDLGICLKECQNMGLALPGLALAQQLYLSLKAHGGGNLGTQALIVALERLNNVSLEEQQAGSTK